MKKILLFSGIFLASGILAGLTATSRAAYETAPFTIVKKEGAVEIRDYPALTTVTTSSESEGDRNALFMKLFGYISGNNGKEEKIAMTTPVFMDEKDGKSQMSFVIPAKISAAGAPAASQPGISIGTRPAGRYAVLRFNGLQSGTHEKEALAQLRKWLEAQKLSATGEPVFAYYDSPWTPGMLRRNEVLLNLPTPDPAPGK